MEPEPSKSRGLPPVPLLTRLHASSPVSLAEVGSGGGQKSLPALPFEESRPGKGKGQAAGGPSPDQTLPRPMSMYRVRQIQIQCRGSALVLRTLAGRRRKTQAAAPLRRDPNAVERFCSSAFLELDPPNCPGQVVQQQAPAGSLAQARVGWAPAALPRSVSRQTGGELAMAFPPPTAESQVGSSGQHSTPLLARFASLADRRNAGLYLRGLPCGPLGFGEHLPGVFGKNRALKGGLYK